MSGHEAGRELDALVAEKVMGWTRGLRYGNGNGEWIEPGRENDAHKRTWDTTPCFSTDIAAAWQVVERMEADGWGHKHLFHSPGAEDPGYYWTFMKPGKGIRSMSESHAETLPLAICLAALKAVGAA